MLQIVTVPGGNGVIIAIPFTSSDNANAAVALLQNLYFASPLLTHIADASSGIGFDGAIAGDTNELVDDVAGQIDVPNGYQYLTGDYKTSSSNPYPVNAFIGYGTFDGAIIDSEATALSFTGGTGAMSIVAGGNISMTTRVTGGGSGELLLDGGGTETVTLSSGNWSVRTGTGEGNFTLGAGTDTIYAEGVDTIRGGTGPVTVTMDHGEDIFDGGNGTATVVDNGGSDSIDAGAGRETVFAQGSGLRVQGGAAEVLFIDVTGHNDLMAGNGGAVVFGGPTGSTFQTGGSYFFFTSGGGSDTIGAAAGAQAPIVFGSPNGRVQINSAAAGSFAVAGSGNETIDASRSSGGVTFFAGTGNSDLLGGASPNFYGASSGDTTMDGGVGNLYEFINGHAGGQNVITDFTPYDQLYLSNFGLGSGDGIVSEVENNGTLDMTLVDGTRILFDNISNPTQLDGHIFHI